ncbi:hypothetical protein RS86_00664 [Microbacterium azadirachtae]|uniref:Uncharacterized protein n=1 Tax=Microbacterium azadirachtae TaxID=582680 RepID=A0A0F0LN84_9MICO|nr:hypothetical protein RS86_00664 [Microbacterium azadirachtae]
MRPWTSDSPATWRTIRPFDQPIALSVPNSLVRRATPESVNSTARSTATASTMIDSHVPRPSIMPAALARDPETVEARSACELTVAVGRALASAVCTEEMSAADAAFT